MDEDTKPKRRNRPRLTEEQKRLITHLIVEEKKSDGEIAHALNLHIDTVIYFRRHYLKIKKDISGHVVVEADTNPTVINKLSGYNEEDKIKNWESKFKSTSRYVRIKELLIPTDLEYFTYQWAKYHAQLEDMSASEEDTLENMILLEIRIKENQRSFKQAQEHEQQLKSHLNGKTNKDLDLENDSDRMLYELIMSNNRVKVELNKEYKELFAQVDKIQESLAVTRRQREEKKQIGSDTFLSLIKTMNDKQLREQVSLYNERMKKSTEKKIEDLKKGYKFIDGTIEPLLLDGADMEKLDQQEQNNE